jgi:hypothetical protein
MNKLTQTFVVASLLALLAGGAQAQRSFTGSVGAEDGTILLSSSNSNSTTYTYQFGTFNYGNVASNTDWFSWNSSGANSGFTQLGSGSISGGLLSLDADGLLFNFNYTAGNNSTGTSPGQIYPLARVTAEETILDDPVLPYLVLTSTRSGDNYLVDRREVLVGQFNTALLGFDPEAVATDNLMALVNNSDFFTALVGGISGSGGGTVLNSASVPEPSSLTLLVLGGAALVALRRRRA